ncbi:MAG: thioredoxin family protein [Bacteroidetes bacterium]|nr:thioredoxin family protein [Bacteroidota bacterium]
MKKFSSVLLLLLAILVNSCTIGQSQSSGTNLSAKDFEAKIKELPQASILDVRTPEEFAKGHLANALNYDWNGSDFDKQIAGLDKSKPVLVYCLSGGRSASAADQMRQEGFKEVYEMKGGILKWKAAQLPLTTDNQVAAKSAGLTRAQFDALVTSDKVVLVDFYAEWCQPCKKMKPYLDEIARDMADKVIVQRINIDENDALSRELKIESIPVLQVYKQGKLVWNNSGFIEKEGVLPHLQ